MSTSLLVSTPESRLRQSNSLAKEVLPAQRQQRSENRPLAEAQLFIRLRRPTVCFGNSIIHLSDKPPISPHYSHSAAAGPLLPSRQFAPAAAIHPDLNQHAIGFALQNLAGETFTITSQDVTGLWIDARIAIAHALPLRRWIHLFFISDCARQPHIPANANNQQNQAGGWN